VKKTAFLATVAFAAFAMPAYAQSAPQQAEEVADDQADQGTIIVTATRRAEVLADVPLAISAITAEKLQNSGVSDIRALNQLSPSLLVSQATSETAASARIRGIGTVGENPGLESSVAVFVDGVYRSRTGVGLTELGEIERVEVLRGPQGTLFGRNASAGLLHVITAGPKFEFGGHADATYGNFNMLRLAGGVTGPIAGDTVAGRLEGVYFKRDGFVKDVVSGRDLHNRDRYLVRGQLLFQPNSDLSIRLIGDYGHRSEECCAATYLESRNLSRDAAGNLVITPNSTAAYERSLGGIINENTLSRRVAITPGRGYGLKVSDWGFSGEVNWQFGSTNLTSITAYRNWKATSNQDGDFNNLDIFYRQGRQQEFKTFTQELRLQGTTFNDRLDWLVGGFYSTEKLNLADTLKLGNDYGTFASCLVAPALVTAAGASPTSPGCVAPAARPGLSAAFGGAGAIFLSGLDRIYGIRNVGANPNVFRTESTNYALFTHNVISIVPDKLKLTLGARYTHEKKDFGAILNNNNTACAGQVASLGAIAGSASPLAGLSRTLISLACPSNLVSNVNGLYADRRKEGQWSGTAVLSYKPAEKLLAYVSFSKGYKAGGFNLDQAAFVLISPTTQQFVTPLTSQLQFAAETVKAYEFGLKWDGPGIDIGFSAYRQAFNNFQLNTFNGQSFIVETVQACKTSLAGKDTNLIDFDSNCAVGDTRAGVISQGIELEVFMRPAKNFSTNLSLAYTDTHYTKDLTGFGGRSFPAALFQLPGRKLSNAPTYTVTGGAGWTPDVGSNGLTGLVYADFRYQSEYNTGSDLDAEKRIGGVLTMNARLGLYGRDKKWGIELWSQNLLNKQYVQVVADAPLQGSGTIRAVQQGLAASANQLYIAFPTEPRTFGVTVKGKF
jgi:iron complex outermembrane recepter protein